MYMVLMAKFRQDSQSREALLSTGDKVLAEISTRSGNMWSGIPGCLKNKEGGMLGSMLMGIREEIRNEAPMPMDTTTTFCGNEDDGI